MSLSLPSLRGHQTLPKTSTFCSVAIAADQITQESRLHPLGTLVLRSKLPFRQLNISTPNTTAFGRSYPWIDVHTSHGDSIARSDSDNFRKHLHPGTTRTGPDRVSVPNESTPCYTKHPVSPNTPYYPWQNMGMATAPFYQVGPSVLSNPATHNDGRDIPRTENDRVIL
ncbi:hypothetical protein L1987_13819 [Smallanthus sonchifolius]|uniref:Uncharacterized protein n=1 Tax=Smallanthus sonchifolius TaxID=185202 RepID=A0ACB9JKA3_9ASTR|nr:hypothetical protein L1987_13819 [Smallanthus sonchifolius]